MKRKLGTMVLLLLLVMATILQAADPYGRDVDAVGRPDARTIRAEREKCVAHTGIVARKLVEEHAPAVAALNAITPETGKKLCEAYNAGVLDKLKIDDILTAVARTPGGGDDTALYVIQPAHARELEDSDNCGAFCEAPLDAALGIKSLGVLAADYRANRLTRGQEKEKLLERLKQPPAQGPPTSSQEATAWAAVISFIALILTILYAVKRWAGAGKQNYPIARREA